MEILCFSAGAHAIALLSSARGRRDNKLRSSANECHHNYEQKENKIKKSSLTYVSEIPMLIALIFHRIFHTSGVIFEIFQNPPEEFIYIIDFLI